MRIQLCLMAILLWTSVARADGGIGVVVTGDAAAQPQLAAQIEDWLRQQGHQLVPSPLPPEALNTLIDCLVIEDLACARTVVERQAKSEMVVYAKAEVTIRTDGMRDIALTVHWFDRGAETVTDRRACEKCTEQRLREMATELMAGLADKGAKDVGTLQLTSIPSGARALVDGKEVGRTPLTYALTPGDHLITIVHPNHANDSRTVTIKKAESIAVDVELEVAGVRAGTLPLAAMGAGGALLLGGVLAYATSQEDDGTRYEYRDTRALGLGLGLLGLAAVGAGAYLYGKAHSRESAPSIAITPDGAHVGWAGSF